MVPSGDERRNGGGEGMERRLAGMTSDDFAALSPVSRLVTPHANRMLWVLVKTSERRIMVAVAKTKNASSTRSIGEEAFLGAFSKPPSRLSLSLLRHPETVMGRLRTIADAMRERELARLTASPPARPTPAPADDESDSASSVSSTPAQTSEDETKNGRASTPVPRSSPRATTPARRKAAGSAVAVVDDAGGSRNISPLSIPPTPVRRCLKSLCSHGFLSGHSMAK